MPPSGSTIEVVGVLVVVVVVVGVPDLLLFGAGVEVLVVAVAWLSALSSLSVVLASSFSS